MYILFILFCALMVYVVAGCIIYPIQYLCYYGVVVLKALSILPEEYVYTMEMAMDHAEIAFGFLVIMVIVGYLFKNFVMIPHRK